MAACSVAREKRGASKDLMEGRVNWYHPRFQRPGVTLWRKIVCFPEHCRARKGQRRRRRGRAYVS